MLHLTILAKLYNTLKNPRKSTLIVTHLKNDKSPGNRDLMLVPGLCLSMTVELGSKQKHLTVPLLRYVKYNLP